MNFSQKPPHQHHSEKFQKSSFLFTQLGLVLALFIVYVALEYSSEKKVTPFSYTTPEDIVALMPTDLSTVIIEKKVVKKQPPIVKKLPPLIPPTIVPNNHATVETVLGNPTDEPPIDNVIDSLSQAPTEPFEPEGTIDFRIIEDVPVYPGCEGLDSAATKKCFTTKISKFVNKKFNTSVAEGLNTIGKQRIWVRFTVDKNGNVVDILAKSPFKQLEKEAIRIVQKLPQMTPGMQRKRPVSVKYQLPIVFFIE